jgi:hypothetical protein
MTSQLRSIPEADNARVRAKAPRLVIAPSILSADFARLGLAPYIYALNDLITWRWADVVPVEYRSAGLLHERVPCRCELKIMP